jgi:hypothetical protein
MYFVGEVIGDDDDTAVSLVHDPNNEKTMLVQSLLSVGLVQLLLLIVEELDMDVWLFDRIMIVVYCCVCILCGMTLGKKEHVTDTCLSLRTLLKLCSFPNALSLSIISLHYSAKPRMRTGLV